MTVKTEFEQLPETIVEQEYDHEHPYSMFNQKCGNCGEVRRAYVVYDPPTDSMSYKCQNCGAIEK